MKKLLRVMTAGFLSVIISASALIAYSAAADGAETSSYQEKLSRRYELHTTYDANRYAVFTADGDTVRVEGRFTDDPVEDFFLNASSLSGISTNLRFTDGGNFEAFFTAKPSANNANGYAVLDLTSGERLTYRIEYDGEWFFGDNGIPLKTEAIIKNALTTDGETCAYYVNEALDPEITRETLAEIREIAASVTDGITDDYLKARALNYWVADNIYYDKDTYNGGVSVKTIALSNVLETKRTVCGGYSNLYAALLEASGIRALNIQGGVIGETCTYEELLDKTVTHEWVMFWYEKEDRWVFADPTWDSRNKYENRSFNGAAHGLKYFDSSPLAASLNHRADKAEERSYFSANEFLQNYGTAEDAEETAETVTSEAETDTASENSENSENAGRSEIRVPPKSPASETDDTMLFVIIGLLCLGVLGAAGFLIKSMRK